MRVSGSSMCVEVGICSYYWYFAGKRLNLHCDRNDGI